MEKFQIFIQLTRLNKPIGFLLLFWPCVWGLTLAYSYSGETTLYLKYIILFFLGSVFMRSAGCIINDIIDRDLDKKIQRTKKRPIASGQISIVNAFIYVIVLCLMALLILLQFNFLFPKVDSTIASYKLSFHSRGLFQLTCGAYCLASYSFKRVRYICL